MLKLCKVLMFGVVLVVTSSLKTPLLAADNATPATGPATTTPTAPATTTPSAPATTIPAVVPATTTSTPGQISYEGKVVVVDRAAKTVTVEIQKRLYLFKLGANAFVVRKGKKVSVDELVTGQQVTLNLIQTATGDVLIASVYIGSSPSAAEAAGAEKGASDSQNSGGPRKPLTPIPAPASVGGSPIVSPYN